MTAKVKMLFLANRRHVNYIGINHINHNIVRINSFKSACIYYKLGVSFLSAIVNMTDKKVCEAKSMLKWKQNNRGGKYGKAHCFMETERRTK